MLLLIVIIYLAFISLGLPDAILGAAWPNMSQDLNASLEYAGLISLVISVGTVTSSLMTARLIALIGIGKLVAISVLLTALALWGFSQANLTLALLLLAMPFGLGAGAVDAALNNYVAKHYQAKHMNYLHSFWGVGATAGPLIMANYLMLNNGWRQGYLIIALIQFALVILLFASLPLWHKNLSASAQQTDASPHVSNLTALAIPGVKLQLCMYFCYCALEVGVGLWAASYLTLEKAVDAQDAAFWTAMFYLGITGGRFLCGLIASQFATYINEENLIRFGVLILLFGLIGFVSPLPAAFSAFGLIFIGLGCAPIFPNTLHLTPKRFNHEASQAIIGLSMACSYLGITLVPPMIGQLVAYFSFAVFPALLLLFGIALVISTEALRHFSSDQNKNHAALVTNRQEVEKDARG